jgi:hypothetical protein
MLSTGDQFLVSSSKLVDIHNHERICGTQTCVCLPPSEKVEPSPRAEYHCQPVPAPHNPPIGDNFLTHAFLNPACIHPHQTWVYNQVPKRTSGKLKGSHQTAIAGWGISFREDWDWAAIWTFLLCFFLVPSLVFFLIWAFYKGDLQAASGVAGYWTAVGTFVLGYYATRG